MCLMETGFETGPEPHHCAMCNMLLHVLSATVVVPAIEQDATGVLKSKWDQLHAATFTGDPAAMEKALIEVKDTLHDQGHGAAWYLAKRAARKSGGTA